MRKVLTAILAVVGAITLALIGLGVPETQAATTTQTPSIEVDQTPQVGVLVTFSTDADCVVNRCDWSWKYVSGGIYKTGGQIGTGPTPVYTFTAYAAAKPYVVVVVKVTQAGGTNNFVLGQRAFTLGTASAAYRISNCQVQYNVNILPMSNTAWCLSTNGAGTQVRAATLCWDQNYSHSMVWVYGPWVYVGSYSHVWCTVAKPVIYTGTYQTR